VTRLSESRRRLLVTTLKLVIVALVVWGIWHSVDKARADFREHEFSLDQVEWLWLLPAALAYLAGMTPMGLFWFSTLRAMRQRPQLASTMRAFFIGHLGKYVPGKALVVVLRTGLIRGPRVDAAVAALSVFVETLTMMAVGAFLAALLVVLTLAEQGKLVLLAIGLMIAAGGPTWPPLFRRIVRLLKVKAASAEVESAVDGLSFGLMARGWLLNLIGWPLLGLSLWFTIQSLPLPAGDAPAGLRDFAQVTAAASLALVAGFVSLIPGGLGVREWVLTELLSPLLGEHGHGLALVAAVLLRLVWLAAELAASAVLWFAVPGIASSEEKT